MPKKANDTRRSSGEGKCLADYLDLIRDNPAEFRTVSRTVNPMNFDVTASEPELVGFLYSLGAGDSMIRVRDISRLRLDPSQTRLTAQVTVVASFQKKPKTPPKAPTPAPSTASRSSK